MPDPFLFLKAMGAAAVVGTICTLAITSVRRPASRERVNVACLLALAFGLIAGCYVLNLRPAWPPASGLDRFLTIVLPVTVGVELIAGFSIIPRWTALLLRTSLAFAIPRILLHGSVYLDTTRNEFSMAVMTVTLLVSGMLLAGNWSLLLALSQRISGVSLPLSLASAIQSASFVVMMAGYIKGGAVAFPLVGTLVATALGATFFAKRATAPVVLGFGVIGLFGILLIGVFFGRVPISSALILFLAPLACWTTEIPFLRHRKPWLVGTLRLVLVAIPLTLVLVAAKRDFDQKIAPLLGAMTTAKPCHCFGVFGEAVASSSTSAIEEHCLTEDGQAVAQSRGVACDDFALTATTRS